MTAAQDGCFSWRRFHNGKVKLSRKARARGAPFLARSLREKWDLFGMSLTVHDRIMVYRSTIYLRPPLVLMSLNGTEPDCSVTPRLPTNDHLVGRGDIQNPTSRAKSAREMGHPASHPKARNGIRPLSRRSAVKDAQDGCFSWRRFHNGKFKDPTLRRRSGRRVPHFSRLLCARSGAFLA